MRKLLIDSIKFLVVTLVLIFCFLGLVSNGFGYLKGDINDDNKIDLSEAIYALQVTAGLKSAAPSKVINVPADFTTIQAAIDAAGNGDTINVAAGMYIESLIISKGEFLTLQGAGRDVTTIQGNKTNPAITITGQSKVTINGFLIRDGNYGISTTYSSLTCSNTRLENNTIEGLRADFNSFVNLDNTIVKFNSSHGVSIRQGTAASIKNSEISQNNAQGLLVLYNATAGIQNSVISNNYQNGIQALQGASIWLIGNQVKSNRYSGLDITGHSTASLWGGNKISGNNTANSWPAGIGIYWTSHVIIQNVTGSSDEISGNNGVGIHISNMSTLALPSGKVFSNHGDGVHLGNDSNANLGQGASITQNEGYGINCSDLNSIVDYDGVPGDLGSEGSPDTRNTLGSTNCY